ncbi:hypothetical protein QE450_000848 [Paenibacillus sp. SORGH_AS306]|uniref:hypothetical protein n=1 Tax=unclassified Paenibacillus TaxID=185978 RepID=UPI002782D30E|nr:MULTISPECIES: hypothetical protein [unclassified Paenibacillus]MDQ1233350.1 hypothetical protein [Paenibacillus sp. SORGH_AS_0306]MDR6110391.1 hypothetical protein [Paenibacillus sp. SORGH_AS_0338]
MRELLFGETKVTIKASPLTPLLYRQSFNSDILQDVIKLQSMQDGIENLDIIVLLQIAYAMAKSAAYGKEFPSSFEKWLSELDGADFSDPEFMLGIVEEAMQGLFRKGFSNVQQAANKQKH